jgi:RNA polymerase sigma-70 factor (ECF subfamily)
MDNKTRQIAREWTMAQPLISSFVTSVVRDFKDRDDVLQEIAVAVFESSDSYDPDRPFLPWAMGIARNQVGLYIRQIHRDRLRFHDDTVSFLATAFCSVAENHDHKLNALSECLKLLEGRAKELCRLRYQEDLKPGSIAKRLGMAPNSVAKALQRIRDQLRDCMMT